MGSHRNQDVVVPLHELKEWIEPGDSSLELDVLLPRLEQAAVAMCGQAMQRYLGAPTTITEIVDGPVESGVLWTSSPVRSLTSVSYRASWGVGVSDWTAFEAGIYELDSAAPNPWGLVGLGRVLRLDLAWWPQGSRNIRLVYEGGYSEPDASANPEVRSDAPEDIQLMVKMQTAHLFRNRMPARTLVNGTLADGAFPPLVQATIDRYRRPTV